MKFHTPYLIFGMNINHSENLKTNQGYYKLPGYYGEYWCNKYTIDKLGYGNYQVNSLQFKLRIYIDAGAIYFKPVKLDEE